MSVVGDVLTRTGATRNDFGQWSRYTPGIRAILTLDFATLPSGPPLAFTATETCRKCPADFTISGCFKVFSAFRCGNGCPSPDGSAFVAKSSASAVLQRVGPSLLSTARGAFAIGARRNGMMA
ncbi:hypothetical protein [Meridianimarinicoccus roseus]|uniref:hypothetical protein n=1 Tax=Meridianimarinicoccus roseus TaxID=2072018 RepID=UPI0011B22F2E|nr:hypothetical protein [Meridianimarinicoccus roseus]